MYVRQAKQFLRTAIDGFDERKYGFASVVDLLRAAGKEGVLRIERDRQGAIRIFPGHNLAPRPAAPIQGPLDVETMEAEPEDVDQEVEAEAATEVVPGYGAGGPGVEIITEQIGDAPIVDVEPVAGDEAIDVQPVDEGEEQTPSAAARKGARKRKTAGAGRAAKSAKQARASKPRARKTSRSKEPGGKS
jgi:hypothetical protein